jgi:predicted cupin superfamily sugar epimerase
MDDRPLSPATHSAAEVIARLGLAPLPREGGFFRRTMESAQRVPGSDRRACSAIYFLLTPENFSAVHAVDADETWCFHAGDAVELLHLDAQGGGRVVTLGPRAAAGESWQHTVPAGEWQGARLRSGGRWALVTCVVAPEYRDEGFVLADRAALTAQFPAWAGLIAALTR